MRIFINALSARRGGAKNYVQYLLDYYPNTYENEIFLVAPESFEMANNINKIKRINLNTIIYKNPFYRRLWEIYFLPKLLKNMEIDVLFCPGGLYGGRVPKNCKLVTTFQNMMPFDLKQRVKYPFGYMRFRNWILEKALLKSMINSELVIFISEYAKSFIEKKSNNRINKSVVIPHGVDSIFFKDSLTNLVIPDDFPKDYLLYISTIEFYKAQIEVIEAYAILKRKINELPKLILMGPEYKPYVKLVKKTIVKNKLQNYVFLKEAIPNKDLPALYQNALINIFASMTENCPLILLEAMASGRPLVVSNYPPMPEFGSTAVEYFNPTNPNDLASLLSKVLSNKDISDQMSKKALIRAKDFDWRVTAKKTWIAINSL